MKIGVMNHPAKSVYDEVRSFGKAGFDFVDLTIEGPKARNVDTEKMRPILKHYNLALTGHTDPCLPWAYPIKASDRPVSMNWSAVPGYFLRWARR